MADKRWDALDSDDLARLRDRRLRRYVRFQLYAYSEYYRELFDAADTKIDGFSGLSDLRKIKTTTRSVLAERPDEFILKPTRTLIQRWGSVKQLTDIAIEKLLRGIEHADDLLDNEYDPVHMFETTGATGTPIPIAVTRRDMAVTATQGRRMLEVAGVRSTDRIMNLLEWRGGFSFWVGWTGGVALGARQVIPGFVDPQDAVTTARDQGVTVLLGFGDDILRLYEAAGETGLPDVRAIILGPEAPAPGFAEKIGQSAGGHVSVIQTYGFAEARAMWSECAESKGAADGGFHAAGDMQVFELMSLKNGEVLEKPQTGELVYTALDQRGTALARYKPGDVAIGGVHLGACPYCGRTIERVIGPVRRIENLLQVQVAGSEAMAIDVEDLAAALAHPGVLRWQVEVTKTDGDPRGADEVVILFRPRSEADAGKVAVALDQSVRESIGFSPTQFVVSDPPGGGIIDRRPVPVGVQGQEPGNAHETPLVRLWRSPEG